MTEGYYRINYERNKYERVKAYQPKRKITIRLEHPTTKDSMSGGWSEAHKSKAPNEVIDIILYYPSVTVKLGA